MGKWHSAIGNGLAGPAPARESAGEVSWDAEYLAGTRGIHGLS